MKLNIKFKEKLKSVVSSITKKSDEIESSKIISNSNIDLNTSDYYMGGYIYDEEYKRTMQLFNQLMDKYGGLSIDEYFGGFEVESKYGPTYCIVDKSKCKIKKCNVEKVKFEILSDLKIIKGIGPKTEDALKNQGYTTIYDLTFHPRFGTQASEIIKNMEKCNIENFLKILSSKYSASHPTIIKTSKFHDLSEFVVYDIETMGLFGVPIILFGMAFVSEDGITTKQFFLRNLDEEPAALYHTLSELQKRKALITFNGKSFDIPYTIDRVGYYRLPSRICRMPNIHYDLLHFSRRAWREQLPNSKLQTIEKHIIGHDRKDDVPSALVPKFYKTYLETGNIGPLVPIIEHNKTDVITSAKILNTLWEEW